MTAAERCRRCDLLTTPPAEGWDGLCGACREQRVSTYPSGVIARMEHPTWEERMAALLPFDEPRGYGALLNGQTSRYGHDSAPEGHS